MPSGHVCRNNAWLPCENAVNPADEICDGLDNNCDGVADNNAPCPAGTCDGPKGCVQRICEDGEQRACGTDEGECRAGTQLCRNNAWLPCENAVNQAGEIYDGLDNNCDGVADNNAPCPVGTFCDGAKGCVGRVTAKTASSAPVAPMKVNAKRAHSSVAITPGCLVRTQSIQQMRSAMASTITVWRSR